MGTGLLRKNTMIYVCIILFYLINDPLPIPLFKHFNNTFAGREKYLVIQRVCLEFIDGISMT